MRIRHQETPWCSDGDSQGARVEKKLVEGWRERRHWLKRVNRLRVSGIHMNLQGVDHETRRMNRGGH